MSEPAGKLKFAYQTISKMEKRIAELGTVYAGARSSIGVLHKKIEIKDKKIAELEADNKAALDRLYDMYLGDDGQAWKEARKFLLAKGYIGEDDKPTQQPDSGGE